MMRNSTTRLRRTWNRLAVFHRRRKRGFADGIDGVLIETEADGPRHRDVGGLAVCADHDVIKRHAGYTMILRELV